MDAFMQDNVGVLEFNPSGARFTSDRLDFGFGEILSMTYGRRGSDFFNRWIEVRCRPADVVKTVFIKDGGQRGWRPILHGTNGAIKNEFQSLLESSTKK
jgi:hypothetical protein